jgi:hypothetical protein
VKERMARLTAPKGASTIGELPVGCRRRGISRLGANFLTREHGKECA